MRNRDVWVRDGGGDTRRAPRTLAEWAAKWSREFLVDLLDLRSPMEESVEKFLTGGRAENHPTVLS